MNNLKFGMKRTELYVLNREWSENYSKYLQTSNEEVVKQISNEYLIEEMKNNERKLEEDLDFVIVNKLVWEVIKKLYEGGPEISYN